MPRCAPWPATTCGSAADFERERRAGQRLTLQTRLVPAATPGAGLRVEPGQSSARRRRRGARALRRGRQGRRAGAPGARRVRRGGRGRGPARAQAAPAAVPRRGAAAGGAAAGDMERRHHPPRVRPGSPARWLFVLSFSRVLLIERGKWTHNRLLRFDLDEILGRREEATLKAAAALLHRDCLLPPTGAACSTAWTRTATSTPSPSPRT